MQGGELEDEMNDSERGIAGGSAEPGFLPTPPGRAGRDACPPVPPFSGGARELPDQLFLGGIRRSPSAVRCMRRFSAMLARCWPATNEKGLHLCKPLILLVGALGLEPRTN